MYKLFFYLLTLTFAAVSTAPVVFNSHFLKGHDHFSTVKHASHAYKVGNVSHVLRFFHLVPKLGSVFPDGFATPHVNNPHHLAHLNYDHEHHHLVDVAGFSDCKNWYAVVMTFLDHHHLHHDHHHAHHVHKVWAFEKVNGEFVHHHHVNTMMELGHFVHTKMPHEHFMDFAAKGVTSHPLALSVLHHHHHLHLGHVHH